MRHSVEIAVPAERAFDFVTTARNWPRYHAASVGVAGQGVDRPARLGDEIVECARAAAGYRGRLIWNVVELERPRRYAIDGWFPITRRLWRRHAGTITYDFRDNGDSVEVSREMEYSAGLLAPLVRLVHGREERECAEAMLTLKAMLEE